MVQEDANKAAEEAQLERKRAFEAAGKAYTEAVVAHDKAVAKYALAGKAEMDKAEEAFTKAQEVYNATKIAYVKGMAGPGNVGGGALVAHTTLVARKKELGKDGEYHYTDERREVRDKVVTDDFAEDIVDNLIAEVSAFGDYKYHHSGTGVGAEAAGDAALGTPVEDARDVGTQVEDGSKVYKSIATTTYTGTYAITEHGLFNTAGAGSPPVVGGILMDRTKFAAINVVSGNQIEWTFTIAFTSGG